MILVEFTCFWKTSAFSTLCSLKKKKEVFIIIILHFFIVFLACMCT